MTRPKDKTEVTTVLTADKFLIDGVAGVRSIRKDALVNDLATALPTFSPNQNGMVPASGGGNATDVLRRDNTWAPILTGPPGATGGDVFEDRVAAVGSGPIDLTIQRIYTACFNKTVSRRRGGAAYIRLSSAPPAALQATTAVIHAVNDTNVVGGSWWIIEARQGGVEFGQLGAVSSGYNNYTTGTTQNAAAFLAYEELLLESYYTEVKTLYLDPGWYAFPDTLVLKRTPVRIIGQGTANDWQKTVFAFPYHKDGVIVHYGNTKGNTTLTQEYDPPESPTNNGGGASGSLFEGFTVWGNTNNPDGRTFDMAAICDGMVLRARAYLRNMFVANFARGGIYVITSSNAATDNPTGAGLGYPAGNANNVRIHDTAVQWCGSIGIRIAGPDSNACSVMDCEANYCGHWGFQDVSFLGPNGLYNFHTTDNGLGVGSTPTHGYIGIGGASKSGALVTYNNGSGVKTYLAVVPSDFAGLDATWSLYCTTVPGTDENVWQYYHDGDGGFSKTWLPSQPRGTYTTGGSLSIFGINLVTACIATYHEGSQPPAQIRCTRAFYTGSQTASNVSKGSYGIILDNYQNRDLSPYVSLYLKNNQWQSSEFRVLASNDVGTPVCNWRENTEFGAPIYEAFEGGNIITRRHQSGTPNSARLSALTGAASTGLGVDGSNQSLEADMNIQGFLSIANPKSFGWTITRLRATTDSEITGMKLGTGDILLYSPLPAGNPQDAGAFVRGGWAGRVVLTGGAAGVSKTWARFGQIELVYQTTVSLGTLAAGASTGWLSYTPSGSVVTVADEIGLAVMVSQATGANVGRVRAFAVGQNGGTIHYEIVNSYSSAVSLDDTILVFRIKK